MTAMGEVHCKNLVARFNCCEIDRHVRLRPAVWLHVHVVCAKQSLRAVNRQLLGSIDIFATAIPALSRITFGILVCKNAPLGFHDRPAREIFRRDQLDVFALPFFLGGDGIEDFRIDSTQAAAGTER